MTSIKAIKIPIDTDQPLEEITLEEHGDYFLKAMQEVVGGWIERVIIGDYRKRERWPVVMYVNDVGAMNGSLPNPRATILYGGPEHGGIIYGDAFIVGEAMGDEGPECVSPPASYGKDFLEKFFAEFGITSINV